MNWIIGTQEEYTAVELSTVGERSFEIETPTGIQTVFIKRVEQGADSLIDMARYNHHNLIKNDELQYLLPVEV